MGECVVATFISFFKDVGVFFDASVVLVSQVQVFPVGSIFLWSFC